METTFIDRRSIATWNGRLIVVELANLYSLFVASTAWGKCMPNWLAMLQTKAGVAASPFWLVSVTALMTITRSSIPDWLISLPSWPSSVRQEGHHPAEEMTTRNFFFAAGQNGLPLMMSRNDSERTPCVSLRSRSSPFLHRVSGSKNACV